MSQNNNCCYKCQNPLGKPTPKEIINNNQQCPVCDCVNVGFKEDLMRNLLLEVIGRVEMLENQLTG